MNNPLTNFNSLHSYNWSFTNKLRIAICIEVSDIANELSKDLPL
jgi:hypothetical protein